jgi:hypothetical protein
MSKKSKSKTDTASGAAVENAVEVLQLELCALQPAASGFNYESTLFTQYLRTTLQSKKGNQELVKGAKITLSVFGETL